MEAFVTLNADRLDHDLPLGQPFLRGLSKLGSKRISRIGYPPKRSIPSFYLLKYTYAYRMRAHQLLSDADMAHCNLIQRSPQLICKEKTSYKRHKQYYNKRK